MLPPASSPGRGALERCHTFLRSNALLVVAVIAVGLWGTHIFRRGPEAFSGGQRDRHALPGAPPADPLLDDSQQAHRTAIPTRIPPHYQMIEGQEVVLERIQSPAAVLLLFHGCQHSATDWWDQQDSCATCNGLPEEKAIVARAVRRSYAVVAFSSMDREGSRCWSADEAQASPDITKTLRSLEVVKAAERWTALPVYALGASSGGRFVGALPFHVVLRGIGIQISQLPSELWEEAAVAALQQRPAVLFVHMARDQRTAAGVQRNVALLQALGGVPVKEISVAPLPLTATFFSDRIEGMTLATSAACFGAFSEGGMLDKDGMLLKDPRSTIQRWQALVREHVPAASELALQPDSSPLCEELNVAWAGHEIISATTDGMLDFFESI